MHAYNECVQLQGSEDISSHENVIKLAEQLVQSLHEDVIVLAKAANASAGSTMADEASLGENVNNNEKSSSGPQSYQPL